MDGRVRELRFWRLAAGIVSFIGASSLSPNAWADARDEAAQHFEHGEQLYRQGSYREAIEEFRAAYTAQHNPAPLYNIGRCHENLGEIVAALQFYEQYLQEIGPGAADRETVEHRLANLRQRPVQVFVSSTPPGARVFVDVEDTAAPGETPLVLRLAPGPHVLILRKSGHRRMTRRIEVDVGEDQTVAVTLAAEETGGGGAGEGQASASARAVIPEARVTEIPRGMHVRMGFHAGIWRWFEVQFMSGGSLGFRVDRMYANLYGGAMRYVLPDASEGIGSVAQIEGGWIFSGNRVEATPFVSVGTVIDVFDPRRNHVPLPVGGDVAQPMTSLTFGIGGQVEYRLFSFLILSVSVRVILATYNIQSFNNFTDFEGQIILEL